MNTTSSISSLEMPAQSNVFQPYAIHSDNQMIVHLGYLDNGKPLYVNIQDKPHLLIAGNKHSGKTTILHNIICSLISTYRENELRLILISSGKSGFSNYNNVPHLYNRVSTEEKSILSALDDILTEIKQRKQTQADCTSYNRLLIIIDSLDALTAAGKVNAMPRIMEIVKDGPAVRIHLVIATNRIGYLPIWNILLNYLDARIVLHVSEQDSKRLTGSDLASRTTTIGEGYAVSRGKTLLHFQSCKVRVKDYVSLYDEAERKRLEAESQSYISNQISQKDFLALDPYQFEEYVAQRMRECGYTKVEVTSKSGDYGADVLGIDPKGNMVCVQCKQYTTKVGFDAIQQVNTARTLFNCQRAVLVTTSTVTNQARNAANSLKVELVEKFNPSTMI